MATQDIFFSHTDFNLLSVKDLLLARDQFHLHLMHHKNVVATAIGRYRIRTADPWPSERNPKETTKKVEGPKSERTLGNSEIRPYSWPALLVFVEEWINPGDFSNPDDSVPPAVFMPDGKKVPVCVIKVDKDDIRPEQDANFNYPASLMGGGYPVICDVQDREHVASVACLVTDGNKTYALTNRHVAGEPGTVISSIIGRNKVPIGTSARGQITRKLFTDLYPDWPGKNVYVDLDVGLIDIDDLNDWTTQVYGIGEIGPLADLDSSNMTLRLIGMPVRAHGAATGIMQGELCALFYRFRSVGGFEYVADALIGPRKGQPLGTRPGDSGTLWLVDQEEDKSDKSDKSDKPDKFIPGPLALQWGGQVFLDDHGKVSSYALVTFLSTVCDQLDVTLLRDWNTGLPEYWGAVGHYSIATRALSAIRNSKLESLMNANLENISFEIDAINKKAMQGLSLRDFVPLADVPDMVWKVGPHKRGGMSSPEHANHFADMDRELDPKIPEGATLLEICDGKPQNVAVEIWQRYYDAVKKQFPQKESRGLLPFRVWQIYDAMVSSVRAGQADAFVCAAGILSHYVGDSCQPLHISYMFNGDPDHPVAGTVRDPDTKKKVKGKVPRGTGVHSAYEDDMVDRHVPEIVAGVESVVKSAAKPPLVTGGHGAAVAVVELMQKTFAAIAPTDLIDQYVRTEGTKPTARADALWKKFGSGTIDVMADGCLCLATLWDSAWQEGGGDTTMPAAAAISQTRLEELYQNPDFLPSHTLDTIGPVLAGTTAPAASPARGRRTTTAGARHATPKKAAKKKAAKKKAAKKKNRT